jgi:hypothetical protein
MNTPALEIIEQKKEAWLGTTAAGLAGIGALHGAATGAAAMRPPGALPLSAPPMAQLKNLGVQAAGVPRQVGGAIRGAVTGAIAPFVGLTKAVGGGLAGQAPPGVAVQPKPVTLTPNQILVQKFMAGPPKPTP